MVYSPTFGDVDYDGPREKGFDDTVYMAKIAAFWTDVIASGVLKTDEKEQYEVYAPADMESLTENTDLTIGLLTEDAVQLKKDNPKPYDEDDTYKGGEEVVEDYPLRSLITGRIL